MNIAEIEMQLSDLVNEPFDQAEFVFKFMVIFNPPPATLTKLRKALAAPDNELLWSRKLHYRTAAPGQTANIVDVLKEQKIAKNKAPRFIISTDGNEFSALDTRANEPLHCDFAKLNDHFDFFLPLAGIDKYKAVDENPADIKATGLLAIFHDEITRNNPDWHTPEKRHALNQFMTRILFCLFSEDTDSFKKDLFVKTITEFGGDNGEQLQSFLKQIFDVMDLPEDQRGNTPAHICAFPYVNGGLFAEKTEVPAFSKRAKRVLIEAAGLDWREINPDIFGSMIQAVVDDSMRGDLGMHYTSVPNIMKVLQPLFLMSLEEEFENARGHREERSMLRKLLARISEIRVFDPACGSGNFLIIAYRELRSLEMRIFQREEEIKGGMLSLFQSSVKLSNFYGIELADFAAETAKLSLWIAEYQMNQRFKRIFGKAPPDFPLKEGGHITHGNALRINWLEACSPSDDEMVETYIVGNPPYLGRADQTKEQKEDLKEVFSSITKSYKNLDYVACWYLKASQYVNQSPSSAAFVATNSICQGEQVAMLWPLIFEQDLEISFAYQAFKWRNNASKNAGVTCVIIGIGPKSSKDKYIFIEGLSRKVKRISPYLIEGDNTYIKKTGKPIFLTEKMLFGSMANDGGNLILSPQEKAKLLKEFPDAKEFVRPLLGSQELIKGVERYCLWIEDDRLEQANRIDEIRRRIEAVRKKRASSKRPETIELSKTPHRFGEIRHDNSDSIVVPKVSSERRRYIPCGVAESNVIISDLAFCINDAPMYIFAILSSRMHIEWIRISCGQLETRLRYSNTLGYNTFPIPELSNTQMKKLEDYAWQIIAARAVHPGKTLAWLYDAKTMPENLLAAHKALDDTLEKIYIGRPFKNDTERLEYLFKLYAKMTAKEKKRGLL
jgi:type I restriction-modification system DNA methylase subunit